MSSPINTIVNVTITQEQNTVPQASFSIPAIGGPSTVLGGAGNYAVYNSFAEFVAAGFTSGDPEYIRVQELLSQALVPEEFVVFQYATSVAQVDTLAVNSVVSSHNYNFTLNGQLIAYTSSGGDTQQSILTALLAAIGTAFPTNPPVTGAVSGSGGSALLTLTSSAPGAAVIYTSIDSDLTHVAVTPNHSIVSDIQTLQSTQGGSIWYGLGICSQHAWDIEQVAAYIETQLNIFIADSVDSNILTNSTTDVASVLQGKSYKRTAIIYSATANDGSAAAWLGGQLPQVPGASTWMFKQLVGITPANLTATQVQTCIGTPGTPGKNCNIYQTVGGVPITENGFMAGGQFIDLTVFLDWLATTMQENVYALMIQAPKIPYTNQGISIVENGVRQTLNQGIANGGIDGSQPVTVSAPDISDIPSADVAERLLPDVAFTCFLSGAIQNVQINGTVSVG